jgi:hypothetical protein
LSNGVLFINLRLLLMALLVFDELAGARIELLASPVHCYNLLLIILS